MSAVLFACAVGVLVSVLSTLDHLKFRASGNTLAGACAALSESGCKEAHASDASEIFGVPISHFGTGFYLAVASLVVFAWVRSRRNGSAVGPAVAPLVALTGLGSVGYSVYLGALLVRANDVCPLCLVLYVVNTALLASGVVWWVRERRRLSLRLLLAAGAFAVTCGGSAFAITVPWVLESATDSSFIGVMEASLDPAEPNRLPFTLPSETPEKGGPWAANEIIEISDLACPHCATLHRSVSLTYDERGAAGVRVRFVNFPLDAECNPYVGKGLHPTACRLARGAICAQDQGRFWPFVNAAFALWDPELSTAVEEAARNSGLDLSHLEACIDADSTKKTLADDIVLAHGAGVRVTPTLLINGLTFEGALSLDRIKAILDVTKPCGCDRCLADGTCITPPPGVSVLERE